MEIAKVFLFADGRFPQLAKEIKIVTDIYRITLDSVY